MTPLCLWHALGSVIAWGAPPLGLLLSVVAWWQHTIACRYPLPPSTTYVGRWLPNERNSA